MGNFVVGESLGQSGVDYRDFEMDGLLSLPFTTRTSTRIAAERNGASLAFEGSGFAFDMVNDRIVDFEAGLLLNFRANLVMDGQSYIAAFTVLNLSMVRFADLVFAEDAAGQRQYVFSGDDRIYGTAYADYLLGWAGSDTLLGAAGGDDLNGGAGSDRLVSGAGQDTLSGASGDDTLLGGLGADALTGGSGRDVFVFETALGQMQRDTITDFAARDDVIKLDRDIFTAFTSGGTIVQSRFHVGVAAADTGDRIIYDRAEGVLSYDRDGRGGTAAVVFALVDPGTALGYQDIVII